MTESYAARVERWSASPAWHDRIIRAVGVSGLQDGDRVLDYGCGTGRFARIVAECGHLVTGVDNDIEALERARELNRYPLASFVQSTVQLQFGTFDRIFMLHTLAHVPHPGHCLQDMWRLLTPGGSLTIITPNPIYNWLMVPRNLLTGYRSDPTIKHRFTGGALRRLLWESGFTVLHHSYVGERPHGLRWARDSWLRANHLVVAGRL